MIRLSLMTWLLRLLRLAVALVLSRQFTTSGLLNSSISYPVAITTTHHILWIVAWNLKARHAIVPFQLLLAEFRFWEIEKFLLSSFSTPSVTSNVSSCHLSWNSMSYQSTESEPIAAIHFRSSLSQNTFSVLLHEKNKDETGNDAILQCTIFKRSNVLKIT